MGRALELFEQLSDVVQIHARPASHISGRHSKLRPLGSHPPLVQRQTKQAVNGLLERQTGAPHLGPDFGGNVLIQC